MHVHRTVADEQRSLALGIQSVLFRLFGSIPGPILFGAIVDSGCVYWQTECGRRANCWVYDNDLLSKRAYAFCAVSVAMTALCTFLAWLLYPPIKDCCPAASTEYNVEPSQESVEMDTNKISTSNDASFKKKDNEVLN